MAPEKFGRFLLGSYCSGGAATAIQYSALTNRITAVLSACTTANSLSTYHVFYYRSNADKDSVAGPKHALAVFNLANRLPRARSLLSRPFLSMYFFFVALCAYGVRTKQDHSSTTYTAPDYTCMDRQLQQTMFRAEGPQTATTAQTQLIKWSICCIVLFLR